MGRENLEKLAEGAFNAYLFNDLSLFSKKLDELMEGYSPKSSKDSYTLSNILFLKFLSDDTLFISLNNYKNKKNKIINTLLVMSSIENGEEPEFSKSTSNELTNILKAYYHITQKNKRVRTLQNSLKTLDDWLNDKAEESMKEKQQSFSLSKYIFLTNYAVRFAIEQDITKKEYELLARIEDKLIRLYMQVSPFNFQDPFLVFNKAVLLHYAGKFDKATKLYNKLLNKDLSNSSNNKILFAKYSYLYLISYNGLSLEDNIRINKLIDSIRANIKSKWNDKNFWEDMKIQTLKINPNSTKRKLMMAILEILSGDNKTAKQVLNSKVPYINPTSFGDYPDEYEDDPFSQDLSDEELYEEHISLGDIVSKRTLSALLNPSEIEDKIVAINLYYYTLKEQKEAVEKGEKLMRMLKRTPRKEFPRRILRYVNWQEFLVTEDLLKSLELKQKRYKRRR